MVVFVIVEVVEHPILFIFNSLSIYFYIIFLEWRRCIECCMPLEGVGYCGRTAAKWSGPNYCLISEGGHICYVFAAYHKYHKIS